MTPAPRRGIAGAIADWWKSKPTRPFGGGFMGGANPTPAQQAAADAKYGPYSDPETRTLSELDDLRTPAKKAADEAAARRSQIAQAFRADATGAAGAARMHAASGPPQVIDDTAEPELVTADDLARRSPAPGTTQTVAEDALRRNRVAQNKASAEKSNFSSAHWREVAARGAELANRLHAEGKHAEARNAEKEAYNAQVFADDVDKADTFGGTVLSNLLGIVKDPHAQRRENIAKFGTGAYSFSPDEQTRELGMESGASAARGTKPGIDYGAPLVGQLPVMIVGGAVGRGVAGIAGALAERGGLTAAGRVLGRLAGTAEEVTSVRNGIPSVVGREAVAQPRIPFSRAGAGVPTLAFDEAPAFWRQRIAEEVAQFRAAVPEMVARGATEGQVVGAIQAYQMARDQGASVEEAISAAAEGTAISLPIGVIAELGMGAAGRAMGAGYDPVGRAVGGIADRIRRGPQIERPYDRRSEFNPEAARPRRMNELGTALDDLFAARRDAMTPDERIEAAAARAPGEQLIEPATTYEPRGAEPPSQPLPTAREAGLRNAGVPSEENVASVPLMMTNRMRTELRARGYADDAIANMKPEEAHAILGTQTPRPHEEANAFVKMQRAQEEARLQAEREANDPNLRLERAAQERPSEVQGPRTLAETIADVGPAAEQGEPLAVEYRDAVNAYVDALAVTRDLPEGKEPGMRQQVKLARARTALNEARKKYGAQFGASAVLALAASNDELTDDEKGMVGLAAVPIVGSVARQHLGAPHETWARLRDNLGLANSKLGQGTMNARPPAEWLTMIMNAAESVNYPLSGEAQTQLHSALFSAQPESSRGLTPGQVKEIITPVENRQGRELYSRLRDAVAARGEKAMFGKKWDEPRPAADWIGKLKSATSFSKQELALIMPSLERLSAEKTKITRDEVLAMIEIQSPRIERTTLGRVEDSKVATRDEFNAGRDPRNIDDFDDLMERDGPTVLREQAGNRAARIAEIRESIDEQVAELHSTMEDAESKADSELDYIRNQLTDAGVSEREARDIAASIRQAVSDHAEPGHVPRGLVDKVMGEIESDLLDAVPSDDPETLIHSKGYVVSDEPEIVEPDGEKYVRIFRADGTEIKRAETGQMDLVDGRNVYFREGAGGPETFPFTGNRSVEDHIAAVKRQFGDDVRVEVHETKPEPVEEYVIRNPDGDVVYHGEDRDDMMQEMVDEEGWASDGLDYSTLRSNIEDFAHRYSDWMEAESAHYDASENESDRFESETEEMERLEDEMHQLAARADELAARPQEQALPAEAASGEAPVDPEAGLLEPLPEKIKGGPEYASAQRIGGGRDYREHTYSWENAPKPIRDEEAYGEHDYWQRASIYDVIAHIRREVHDVQNTPGLSSEHVTIPEDATEEEVAQYANIKNVRARLNKALDVVNEILREFEGLPKKEQEAKQSDYIDRATTANQKVIDLQLQEEKHAKVIRESLAARGKPVPEPVPMFTIIEAQSSFAQQQAAREPAPTPEMLAAKKAKAAEARLRADQANDRLGVIENDMAVSHQELRDHVEKMPFDQVVEFMKNVGGDPRDFYLGLAQRIAAGEDAPDGYTAEIIRRHAMNLLPSAENITWARLEDAEGDHVLDENGIPRRGEEMDDDYYSQQWKRAREGASPELAALMDRALADRRAEVEVRDQYRVLRRQADEVGGGDSETLYKMEGVEPFNDVKVSTGLAIAGGVLEATERGYSHILLSDAKNRIANATMKLKAAVKSYDEFGPSALRRILEGVAKQAGLSEKITIDKVYVRGNGHWHVELSPEMRKAIRRYGLPILGVMALMPSEAEAQGEGGASGGSLYATGAGGIAAGAALVYLATSRKARRLVKENRDLARAIMLDDLSGLANGRAFRRAQASVDHDPTHSWAVFDANHFKTLNDVHGHGEGDKAIQHYGQVIRDVAESMGIPMRGFRKGGDEFQFAVPKEKAAEFVRRVEEASGFTKGDLTTDLSGAHGDTYTEADALLNQTKEDRRVADPSLRRTNTSRRGGDGLGGATLHANPIGLALRELARFPSAAALAGVGVVLAESDDPDLQKSGLPVMALAALSAVGSRRIAAGRDKLGKVLLDALSKSPEGTSLVRAFHPDALLHPEVREAIHDYEADRSRAAAKAAEMARRARALGPEGDRAVSDVIEGEDWEDTSNMSADDLTAVMTFAAALDQEYQAAAKELLATGARTPEELLPDYAGPRRYAYHEAQAAQEEGGPGPNASGAPRIKGTKHRTLDEPVRAAEAQLRTAKASGDPAAITQAQDALDAAEVERMSKRIELGEIRESSYRSAQGIERAYADAAAARLFTSIRNVPGAVHPEWAAAIDDLKAAKQMKAAAATPADRDAAKALVDDATVRLSKITRQFSREGGDYVALPDSRSMGELRGAIVKRDIAHSLTGFSQTNLYAKALRAWKEVKTVFNPGTHQGNILSNIAFSHMEGLPMWEQPIYLKRAAQDMKRYGPATQALAEAGILDVNAVNDASRGVAARDMNRREGLEELLGTTRPETADVLREQGITEEARARRIAKSRLKGAAAGAVLGAAKMYSDEDPEEALAGAAVGAGLGALVAGGRARKVRHLYNNEDNIFRAAIWMKKVKDGMTPEEATAYTRNALGNFRSRSPAMHVLRSTVAPFVLYPAKALPRFASQVVDHPWRYVALMALWGGLNEYSQSQVGEVDEHDLALRDRNSLGYALPGFTQLPFGNKKGERAGVDISRWTPVSAVTTGAPPGSLPASFDEGIPDIFRPGGPVIDAAAKFGVNVDPFSAKPFLQRDYPASENAAKLASGLAGVALPSALDFQLDRVKADVENRDWDKLKNDMLGPTGLRPRFVRPGAVTMDAQFTLRSSLMQMKQDYKRDLLNNQNRSRDKVLFDRYLRRVQQALQNFRERTGLEPSTDDLKDALDVGRD